LDAISKKNAIDYGTKDDTKAAKFAGERVAAMDKGAAQELILEHNLEGAKEKIFDDTVKYHIEGLNAGLLKQYKIEDDQVHYHIQALNAGLQFEYNVRNHITALNKAMEDDRVKAADEELKGAMDHGTRMLELKRLAAGFDEKGGEITAEKRIAIDRSIDAEEEALQRKAIQREIDLLELKNGVDVNYASKHEALLNKLQQLEDGHRANQLKAERSKLTLQEQIATETKRLTDGMFNSMERGLASDIVHWKGFSTTIKDIFSKLGEDILTMMLHSLLKPVEKLFADVLTGIAEKLLGVFITTKIGASAADVGEVAGAAAVGGAAAAASIAAIPIVGPALALEAGAAMYASILGVFGPLAMFKQGGDVPMDMNAMLHKNEMVLPADIAIPLRQMVKNSPVGGGGIIITGNTFHGVARETVNLLAGQMIRQARLAGARI
jgi:hypothetical protein